MLRYGEHLRQLKSQKDILPFIGIYDVFSASVAAKHYDTLFVSGFGFAASHYGLPDIGFNTWTDLLNFVSRLRNVLPGTHLLVDIDDGFVDIHNAKMITACLRDAGASGIVLEDQARPRCCGHYNGKNLLQTENYIEKLKEVLSLSDDLFVVARTDASKIEDIEERVSRIKELPVDCVLVDGMSIDQICSFDALKDLRREHRIVYNQIHGGKSSPHTLPELAECGVGIAIYSTPCLFSAQYAINNTLTQLESSKGLLSNVTHTTNLTECTELLNTNMKRRFKENETD
ncbi:isocitrate lyase/PEP mutase family protein [Legionella sp. PATHC038]|uniref:isocitrate lyase/PEP mutase family protein n=1 Tax=Legionella sheltonii TaxID=2992041 RepID=UPI0022443C90|nr:isocitrate lyase/PEP mutase family protein [Legionella sp. PATHC038]MCW8399470.1 isocitrate lyase/PEP mutase family protein [Legionella sp. PATHC038]